MRRIFLAILLVVLVGYGLILILRGPARRFTAAILSDSPTTPTKDGAQTQRSFAEDSDQDGLSDAKEHIYGTDPNRADTDGDGFSDGAEVRKGFDPTVPGSPKIVENTELMANLTVRYFEWARAVGGTEDPQLNDDPVRTFLEAAELMEARIPKVEDSELTSAAPGTDAVRAYFQALREVKLPDVTASYIELADEIIRNKRSDILDDVLAGLVETTETIRAIPTPPELWEVQREQVALLKGLRDLFSDLYAIERDPVLLVRDLAWSEDLLAYSFALESKRREIAADVLGRELASGKPAE